MYLLTMYCQDRHCLVDRPVCRANSISFASVTGKCDLAVPRTRTACCLSLIMLTLQCGRSQVSYKLTSRTRISKVLILRNDRTQIGMLLYHSFDSRPVVGPSSFARSRNMRRRIFPEGLFGIASTKRTPPRSCL